MTYFNDGFVILKNAISKASLGMIHRDLSFLGVLYAKQLSIKLSKTMTTPEVFCLIEDKNKDSFYELATCVGDLASMNNMGFNSPPSDIFQNILSTYNAPLVATHSGLFFNKKNVSRLQYKWHQEKSYYPKHQIGCHIWYPLYNSIKVTGGPMLMKKESHQKVFE